jgi:hypothetical protein
VPDVVGALRDGRFYASQGPRFEQLELTEDELIVTCSPVDTVIFYSSLVWLTIVPPYSPPEPMPSIP